MMRPTKYPSSVKTVRLTLFPCLHVVRNRVNVPSDAELGSHTDSRIEVMGCLVSSDVKMEQIHPDLSLHTEMYMSEQMAISTDRMMISFFIGSSMNRSGQDDLIRLDYRRLSVLSLCKFKCLCCTTETSDHIGYDNITFTHHPLVTA